jgi:hypothetical protein
MTDANAFSPAALREAMIRSLPWEASSHGKPPEPRFFYVPAKHVRALHFDAVLIVGIRGSGKSVWFGALRSPEHRKVLAESLAQMGPRIDGDDRMEASPGFGSQSAIDQHPDEFTLQSMVQAVVNPRLVWRTVMAWQTWGKNGDLPADWTARARWVSENPQEVAARFHAYDQSLVAGGRRHVILFDALDRTSEDLAQRRGLLKGLFQTLLDFRGYQAIRAKAAVRPDMIDDDVKTFTDASKVFRSQVELEWDVKDLFALLWQYLGNDDMLGPQFRAASSPEAPWTPAGTDGQTVYIPPHSLRFNQRVQQRVFHKIANWPKGKDRIREPYEWLPNHLADALRQVSPRSFLAALHEAAVKSAYSERSDHPCALDEASLWAGVQAAAQIRIEEVREDHPWVSAALTPLQGLVIPCEFGEMEQKWQEVDVLGAVRQAPLYTPKHLSGGCRGLLQDLKELGFVEVMVDSRINVPEVYRFGYGLLRRGGTKRVV